MENIKSVPIVQNKKQLKYLHFLILLFSQQYQFTFQDYLVQISLVFHIHGNIFTYYNHILKCIFDFPRDFIK